MQNSRAHLLALSVSFVALVAAAACGGKSHGASPTPTPVPALTLVSSSPADGDTGASATASIDMTFSATVDPSTTAGAVTVSTGAAVAGTVSILPDGKTLRFIPAGSYGTLRTVNVTVATTLRGADGEAPSAPMTFSFRTVPSGVRVTPPRIAAMKGSSQTISLVLVGDGGQADPGAVTWTSSNPVIATVSGSTVSLLASGTASLATTVDAFDVTVPVAVASSTGRGSFNLFTNADYHDHDGTDDFHLHHSFDLECTGGVTDGGNDEFDNVWDPFLEATTLSQNTGNKFTCSLAATLSAPSDVIPGLVWADKNDVDGKGNGTGSCHLRPGESYMYQDVTIGAAPTTLDLSWQHATSGRHIFTDSDSPAFVVTVQNRTDMTAPVDVFTESPNFTGTLAPHALSLLGMGLEGKTVRITFRAILSGNDNLTPYDTSGGAWVDDVSLLEDGATQRITNGACDTSTAGWTGSLLLEPRQVTIGPFTQTDGLDVTRSIYAPWYDGYWIRYLDTFTNNTGAAITTYVRMEGDLGSDGGGVVTPILAGKAFVEWDSTVAATPNVGNDPDPNLALIPGNATVNDVPDQSGEWSSEYALTVPAGQSVSILAFHVFGNGNLESDLPFVENLAGDIVQSVSTLGASSPYAVGITSDQFATVQNWQ